MGQNLANSLILAAAYFRWWTRDFNSVALTSFHLPVLIQRKGHQLAQISVKGPWGQKRFENQFYKLILSVLIVLSGYQLLLGSLAFLCSSANQDGQAP